MGFIINPGAVAQAEWTGGLWTDVPLSDTCKDEPEVRPGVTVEGVLVVPRPGSRLELTDAPGWRGVGRAAREGDVSS